MHCRISYPKEVGLQQSFEFTQFGVHYGVMMLLDGFKAMDHRQQNSNFQQPSPWG